MSKNKYAERVIGVIQARMNSSRLPGKVMLDILGRPLVWHIVNRLRYVKTLSDVVISTTDKDSDKKLRQFAESENISYYAGSEDDILDRLYKTGKKFNATALVKINADCPLIDPEIIDTAIQRYLSTSPKPDLVANSVTNTYPEGLQFGIFNFKTLCKLWNSLTNAFWRGYVYMYIIENRNNYSVINIENKEDLSSLRWTVDYKEDLEFVREIYRNLYDSNKPFIMSDILTLLKANPEIQKINAKYNASIGKEEYKKLRDQQKMK